jgi:hypothetical protein
MKKLDHLWPVDDDIDLPESLDIGLSSAFDSGNYDESYQPVDIEALLESREGDEWEAWRSAYLLGYYSSYEIHEIPDYARDEYQNALHSIYAKRMRDMGIAIDELEQEEI